MVIECRVMYAARSLKAENIMDPLVTGFYSLFRDGHSPQYITGDSPSVEEQPLTKSHTKSRDGPCPCFYPPTSTTQIGAMRLGFGGFILGRLQVGAKERNSRRRKR